MQSNTWVMMAGGVLTALVNFCQQGSRYNEIWLFLTVQAQEDTDVQTPDVAGVTH